MIRRLRRFAAQNPKSKIQNPKSALILVVVLYIVGLVVMPPEGLTHHDTGAKYLQVRNLRLTPSGLDYSINYPARLLDPQLQYVPFKEKQYYIDGQGRIYLQWPIFLGLLTRIPWKVLGFWGLYVVPLLAGLGACWAAYLLALAVGAPRRVAWLAVPLVGLATPIAIYSLLFFEHTLAAMLVALSLLFAVRAISLSTQHTQIEDGLGEENWGTPPNPRTGVPPVNPARSFAISGALLAIAIYFRSDLYVMALVMALVYGIVAWRVRARRWLFVWWIAGFLVVLAPLWVFYAVTEGTLLPLHATWYFAGSEGASLPGEPVKFELPALRYIAKAGWGIVPDFLLGPQSFPLSPVFPLWVGVLGVGGIALCGLGALGQGMSSRLSFAWLFRQRLWVFAVGLGSVGASSAYILLSPQPYHNLHGFLMASPFIAMSLWPPKVVFTRLGLTPHGLLYVVTLAHVGLHTLVISALSGLGPISRSEWGQRYLLTAYPGLVVLALLAAWRLWSEYRPTWRLERASTSRAAVAACLAVAATLALIGVLFSLRGYTVLYDERTQVKAWQELARTLPDREPLITDDWWLPLNLAADFYTRPIMLASGDEKLAQWANEMRGRGVAQFGFMTDKPGVFGGKWRAQVAGLSAVGPPEEVRGIWMQRFRFK